MDKHKTVLFLKVVFLIGAVTDALALVPMLFPAFAKSFWGFSDYQGNYFFAMDYGASLMFGWTFLLIWAFFKPFERRLVALFTMLVIAGFILTEIISFITGNIGIGFIIPSLIMQTILMVLFGFGFIYSHKFIHEDGSNANT